MLFFKKKEVLKRNFEIALEQDTPIKYSQVEIEDGNHMYISFDNGFNVYLKQSDNYIEYRVFSPTHDVTQRFYKLVHGSGLMHSDILLRLLNAVANLPSVYTVTEIPDSCFNFENSGSNN